MNWTLDKTRPISRQLCEKICLAISTGEYGAGEKLLSVRDVALAAGVNPNTVQKSFEELERRGVIHSVPCSGWYVNENTETAESEVELLRRKNCEDYLAAMQTLGCKSEQAMAYLETFLNESEDNKNECASELQRPNQKIRQYRRARRN